MADLQNDADLLLRRLRQGESAAHVELFDLFRPRLRRMIDLRMDARLRARVDPSDVLQEAWLESVRRLPKYVADTEVAPYVWLRGLAAQRLFLLERHHLGAQRRAVQRECALPMESSMALANQLLSPVTGPSVALLRDEMRRRVQAAVDRLKDEDREVILMRHFEEMTNGEVAQALDLTDAGASMRYGRAVVRLKEVLLDEGSR